MSGASREVLHCPVVPLCPLYRKASGDAALPENVAHGYQPPFMPPPQRRPWQGKDQNRRVALWPPAILMRWISARAVHDRRCRMGKFVDGPDRSAHDSGAMANGMRCWHRTESRAPRRHPVNFDC